MTEIIVEYPVPYQNSLAALLNIPIRSQDANADIVRLGAVAHPWEIDEQHPAPLTRKVAGHAVGPVSARWPQIPVAPRHATAGHAAKDVGVERAGDRGSPQRGGQGVDAG